VHVYFDVGEALMATQLYNNYSMAQAEEALQDITSMLLSR
jgi:hypothetical protein